MFIRLGMTENQSTKHSSTTNPSSKTVFGLKKGGQNAPQSPIPTKTLELNIEEKAPMANLNSAKVKMNVRGAQSIGKKPPSTSSTKHTIVQRSPPAKYKEQTTTKKKDSIEIDALLISKTIITKQNKDQYQKRFNKLFQEDKRAP